MKEYITEANDMFTTPIHENLSPLELTKEFINDTYIGNAYAYDQNSEDEDKNWWNKWKSYENLIAKYCGPGKSLNEYKDFKENIQKDKATMAVDHVNPNSFTSGFVTSYEFEFQKKTTNEY